MADALMMRGPDDWGIWQDEKSGVVLAHRRLAIQDLSQAGHQPMSSATGRYSIVFNGEIYNHVELRNQLGSCQWRGHADTETILAALEAWGLTNTLKRLVGMFAIALWDRERGELTLVRDRLGEKPLYYGWQGKAFLFGSELKALREHPSWGGQVDRNALASYMRFGYVPLPHSMYRGIHKLLPGCFLTIKLDAAGLHNVPVPEPYWSALECARAPRDPPANDSEAIQELDGLLRKAVAGQMVADVPLGAFLSGGVDSSTVVAVMQSQASRPVRTFSIGFAEGDYDEARYAKKVAEHLGTDHTELYVSPEESLAVIPQLPQIYDEPFGDSSQIPTYLVAQMARRHVTVSLSGDAGDELFGGYNRYFWGRTIWHRLGHVPLVLRTIAARAMTSVGPARWDRMAALLPRSLRLPALGDKVHKLASVLDVGGPDELYRRLISQHRDETSIVLGGQEAPLWADGQSSLLGDADFTERMMFHDLVGYLTDDILVKVDRAAMAVSLETRIPMLDHRIVEFSWRLPLRMKIRNGQGKWLLRQLLYRYVPKELIERPKQGFSIPLDSWLRGPLREWAEELLDDRRLREQGFLDPGPVKAKWIEHLSGQRNWQHWLWNVLMFQAWLERQGA
jgi:asparagine synthase (glutamine-hydrolysing)